MSKTSTYPLRLSASVMAVAEKMSAMQTATFFDDRANVADRKAFLKILKRKGGEAPRVGDEVDSSS